jgi:hypothetical protein
MKSFQNFHNYDWKGLRCQPYAPPSSVIVILNLWIHIRSSLGANIYRLSKKRDAEKISA